MLQTLRDSLRTNVIRPNRIYEKLKIICKHMVQGRQEDAHEFLRYLIESLQRSYLNTIPGSKQLDSVSKETTPLTRFSVATSVKKSLVYVVNTFQPRINVLWTF